VTGVSRRRFIAAGLTGAAAAAAGVLELIDHGDLPGKHYLDELDGACSVAVPSETFAESGPTVTGRFFSQARGREVNYLLAYPPGHGSGDHLALGVLLHPSGGDHTSSLGRVSAARALAGNGIAPLALVACDGGDLYWNPHPGDNPMAMLIDEVIPMCQRRGLGRARGTVGAIGESMGGYGALLLAETYPTQIAAVAAISPAIFTSYSQAVHVNSTSYASARDFARDDVIAHAAALKSLPVRVASGAQDPFHPGVVQLVRRLGAHASVDLTGGCHDANFFDSQQQRSLEFLSRHLSA
jgi:enterochelin esterase-like enzyme